MRYATVGTSWITDAFIEGARIAGGLELAAVYSRSSDTGRAFSDKYGGVPVFTDLQELARSPLIDSVYIASPNSLHYSQSKLFLLHGKNVLCEKPATVTPDEFRELDLLARENKLIYMEAIMMRHLPARSVVHNALKEIGRISSAHFDFSQLSSKYPLLLSGQMPNIFNPEMAAGCLMDLGIYCVYAAVDFFGLPDSIKTSAVFLRGGADGCGCSVFEYKDKLVTLSYSKTGQSCLGSEIIGDKGTITIESISKLIGIKLKMCDADKPHILVGDIPKAQLMSGEAAAFRRLAGDPDGCRSEIDEINRLTLRVSETMETMREQAGIRFRV